MNRKPVLQWVDALSSEKYKQNSHFLSKDENSFCALGVLCEVYATTTGRGKWKESNDHRNFILNGEDNICCIPDDVADWVGIPYFELIKISVKNDQGMPFQEIATQLLTKLSSKYETKENG